MLIRQLVKTNGRENKGTTSKGIVFYNSRPMAVPSWALIRSHDSMNEYVKSCKSYDLVIGHVSCDTAQLPPLPAVSSCDDVTQGYDVITQCGPRNMPFVRIMPDVNYTDRETRSQSPY